MKKIIVLILFVQILINVYSQDSINRNLNIVNPQNIVPEYHCEPFVISVKMKVLEDEELVKGVVISRVIPKCKRDSMMHAAFLKEETINIINAFNCYEYRTNTSKNKNIILTYYDSTKSVREIIEVKKKTKKSVYIKNGVYIKLSISGNIEILGEYSNNRKTGIWYGFNQNNVISFQRYSKRSYHKVANDKRCGCIIIGDRVP